MFTNPTTPNLADYLQFLSGVVGIPDEQFPTNTGVATGGDNQSLTDNTQPWPVNKWNGYALSDITQGHLATVDHNDGISSYLFTAPVLTPTQIGDVYFVTPPVAPVTLAVAMRIVNPVIGQMDAAAFAWAVYNLAVDRLIAFAPDQPGQSYFQDLRDKLRLTDPAVGVVSMASNDSTTTTYVNPEQMRLFTLRDLQALKTPYGREYLAIAQSYGRVIWGLT